MGPRSRFGEGDGSFFDAFLVCGMGGLSKGPAIKPNRKCKHSIEIPKGISQNGPLHGFKSHYMFYQSDPNGEKRRNVIKTYEQRQSENEMR